MFNRGAALGTGIAACLAALLTGGRIAVADVKPHALISDNMVLQEGMRCPVWGTAEPGEEVTVSIGRQSVKGNADAKGKWMVKVGAMKAGGALEMTIAGKNTVTVKNVLVGEVWLGSGQSNMNFSVSEGMNAAEELAAANRPEIRLFRVYDQLKDEPQEDVRGRWQVCDPKSVKDFSAAAYFFGRELHKELKVPMGLIAGSHGSSKAEAWMDVEALKKVIKDPVGRWEQQKKDVATDQAKYDAAMEEYKKAKAEGKQAREPREPYDMKLLAARLRVWQPGGWWNGTILPLVPYGIQGVIWYQGESNADSGREHRKLLPALIESWRAKWGEGDFPFLIVQIAPFGPRIDRPTEVGWSEVQEAQWMTAEKVANCGLAVTADIGDAKEAHPLNKQEVGRRLALVALAKVYGKKDVVYSGPMYTEMKAEGNKVRLSFKHVEGGLTAKPEGTLVGFAVAGKDRKFVWAQAKIEKDQVVVWSDEVREPVAVRYAWAKNPACNLFNGAGLPAVPFRTDDWEYPQGK